jgi:hypothetical protein
LRRPKQSTDPVKLLRRSRSKQATVKALKAIEAYKEDKLAKFISTMGGAEKARTELANLKVWLDISSIWNSLTASDSGFFVR